MRNQSSVDGGLPGTRRRRLPAARGPLVASLSLVALLLVPAVASAGLPNNRAYEMVSPVNKNGGAVLGAMPGTNNLDSPPNQTQRMTPDGTGITYQLSTALPGAEAAPIDHAAVSTRDSSGWTTRAVAPPTPVVAPAYFATGFKYSRDLERTVFTSVQPLTPDAPTGVGANNVFLRNRDGSLRVLTSNPPVDMPESGYLPYVVGASPDLSKVIFEAAASLTSDTQGVSSVAGNLYQWEDGEITPVGVLPDGSMAQGSAAGADTSIVVQGGAPYPVFGGGMLWNAVSEDASRVFFGPRPAFTYAVDPRLYVRIDGSSTKELTKPGPGGNQPDQPAYFDGAAKDGSVAYFTTASRLTADSTATTAGAGLGDLYRYDVDSETLTDITVTNDPVNPDGALMETVAAVSDDGEYVYFVAKGQLVPGQGTAGESNLYVWHDGETRFVARADVNLQIALTPDGRHLAYRSLMNPAGVTTLDAEGTARKQIYLYDADEGQSPTCISCGAPGSLANGDAFIEGKARSYPGALSDAAHNISDDGRRVFFSSRGALVAGMRVDRGSPRKVYQYERSAVGDPGTVSMISSPAANASDLFVDATPDGDSVFFVTSSKLVGRDTDTADDLYVARVGGGFTDASSPPCDPSINCRSAYVPAERPLVAGSVSFVGPGDPASDGSTKKLSVSKVKAVYGTAARLRVTVPGKGTVETSGPGLRRSTKAATKAGTVTATVRLSQRAQHTLKRKHRVRVRVAVRFTPAEGRSSVTRVAMTFRSPSTKKGER